MNQLNQEPKNITGTHGDTISESDLRLAQGKTGQFGDIPLDTKDVGVTEHSTSSDALERRAHEKKEFTGTHGDKVSESDFRLAQGKTGEFGDLPLDKRDVGVPEHSTGSDALDRRAHEKKEFTGTHGDKVSESDLRLAQGKTGKFDDIPLDTRDVGVTEHSTGSDALDRRAHEKKEFTGTHGDKISESDLRLAQGKTGKFGDMPLNDKDVGVRDYSASNDAFDRRAHEKKEFTGTHGDKVSESDLRLAQGKFGKFGDMSVNDKDVGVPEHSTHDQVLDRRAHQTKDITGTHSDKISEGDLRLQQGLTGGSHFSGNLGDMTGIN